MSGHSHWAGIKHKKELEDKKRAKIFSKLTREISVAAKDGADPDTNPRLRMAIERAKDFNMPLETIERAIKKGSGQLEAEKLEEVIYEATGPSKSMIIIEGITNNKNRTLNEVKQILSRFGAKLVQEGSLRWLFQRMGIIEANQENKNREEIEMQAIEAGAEDLRWRDDVLEIYTKPEELDKVRNNLLLKKIKILSARLGWVPKEEITLKDEEEKRAIEKLFEALDENDDIQAIYSNINL